MKKAKLMLSAMALFAVLATAFAFKAQDFSVNKVYTGAIDQPNGATACQTEVQGRKVTTTGTTQVRASTVSLNTGCPITFTASTPND
jgi:hypothetical protein